MDARSLSGSQSQQSQPLSGPELAFFATAALRYDLMPALMMTNSLPGKQQQAGAATTAAGGAGSEAGTGAGAARDQSLDSVLQNIVDGKVVEDDAEGQGNKPASELEGAAAAAGGGDGEDAAEAQQGQLRAWMDAFTVSSMADIGQLHPAQLVRGRGRW